MDRNLINIGPKSWVMLENAGFTDVQSVRVAGAVGAFVAVLHAGGQASFNLLYALAAGLEGRHWTDLSEDEKGRLKREVEDVQDSLSPPAP